MRRTVRRWSSSERDARLGRYRPAEQGETMSEPHGWTAPGFEGVRDAFARNFDEGQRDRRRVQRVPPRPEGRRSLGRDRRRAHRPAVGGGLDRPRVLDDQGHHGRLREPARARGRARRRRAGGRVLARVRRQAGKENVPVSYLLSHQVGLPDIDGGDDSRRRARLGSGRRGARPLQRRCGSRARSTATTPRRTAGWSAR